LARAR
jgi:DNA replication protein DnaC